MSDFTVARLEKGAMDKCKCGHYKGRHQLGKVCGAFVDASRGRSISARIGATVVVVPPYDYCQCRAFEAVEGG